ncbi:hypothetical protein BO86DRAFT_412464 [Aspergillus japonicus CBS 114.51]|uniref:MACPF domain-containing protein n=1 Tax=Aspergillus japonicus CBS 114.51 TaxID=1448312 RepID=A0A8T8WR25_ASPJA|nr:hypothetical protein BO86DRAFT_412464 [Aspergillus japonicus CBS 114.51]RAH78231.1 hypothetical protein BO86DRAFT_412464 [Aspergillus japonicus CBS 114.51]
MATAIAVNETGEKELLFQNLLGSTVNILDRPNIFDIDCVVKARKDYVVLDLATTTKKVSVPGVDQQVLIRNNVELISNGNGTELNEVEVKTGSQLIESFKADVNATGKYAAMSVEAGGGYSYEATIDKSSMYAVMSIEQNQFYTYLYLPLGREQSSLNADFLAAVNKLPAWQQKDEGVTQAYRAFFDTFGTHVILRCQYGCRFSLETHTSNAAFKSQKDYKANVKAEFGANFSASSSVAKTSTFSEYQDTRTITSKVMGGDKTSSMKLQHDPGDKTAYYGWAESINEVNCSAVTSVRTEGLGTLLDRCGVPQGKDLTKALKCFTLGPESEPILVHGVLSSDRPSFNNYLTFRCWGDGLTEFELTALAGSEVKEDSEDPSARSLSGLQLADKPAVKHFAAQVRISGVTGRPFSVGIYTPDTVKPSIRLTLYPPSGPIEITFDKSENWDSCTIPSLLASGKYTSK